MFSAHLIFGDINNHSKYSFKERVGILKKYWIICNNYKPNDLNEHSFYETDNDSLMIGFSSQYGFFSGYDILNLIGALTDDFVKNNISVSFGINLMACGHDIEWKTMPGFIDDLKLIHMPDEIYNRIGRIQRSRLAGDSLIITARLQSLAKKLGVLGCVSVFQGGHINQLNGYKLTNGKKIEAQDVSNEFIRLGDEHNEWLNTRKVKAYSIELL